VHEATRRTTVLPRTSSAPGGVSWLSTVASGQSVTATGVGEGEPASSAGRSPAACIAPTASATGSPLAVGTTAGVTAGVPRSAVAQPATRTRASHL
jgi:hypothetical protein